MLPASITPVSGFQSSVNVTGVGNTAAGASSGQNVTGIANSALGVGSGQSVTGNANIAIGQNAGSAGTLTTTASANVATQSIAAKGDGTGATQTTQSQKRSLESTVGDQTVQATPQASQSVLPNTLAVIGDNNIAIGTNAGQGTGTSFSDTVAIGTAASASQASAVAIGANSSAIAANSVAIGAGSIADQANTVSVGSVGSERRITNVAPGVNATDAATFGQLTTAISATQQEIQQVSTVASKGIAISLAQAGTGNAATKPGEMSVVMGTGYFQGETAIGLGLTGSSKDGERVFRLGSGLSPGLADIGMQASYQIRVGKASPGLPLQRAGSAPSETPEVPYTEWKRFGFSDVLEESSGSVYHASVGARTFRISINKVVGDTSPAWLITVDEKQRDGMWRSVDDQVSLHSNHDVSVAMHEAIVAISKFVQ